MQIRISVAEPMSKRSVLSTLTSCRRSMAACFGRASVAPGKSLGASLMYTHSKSARDAVLGLGAGAKNVGTAVIRRRRSNVEAIVPQAALGEASGQVSSMKGGVANQRQIDEQMSTFGALLEVGSAAPRRQPSTLRGFAGSYRQIRDPDEAVRSARWLPR